LAGSGSFSGVFANLLFPGICIDFHRVPGEKKAKMAIPLNLHGIRLNNLRQNFLPPWGENGREEGGESGRLGVPLRTRDFSRFFCQTGWTGLQLRQFFSLLKKLSTSPIILGDGMFPGKYLFHILQITMRERRVKRSHY